MCTQLSGQPIVRPLGPCIGHMHKHVQALQNAWSWFVVLYCSSIRTVAMNWRFMTWRHSHSKHPIHRWCSVPETCHTDHIVMVASSLVSFVCRRSIWWPPGRQLDSRHLDPQPRSDQRHQHKTHYCQILGLEEYCHVRADAISKLLLSNDHCDIT